MDHKIKILFVTRGLSFGGLERVVINLCRYIDKDVFEPVVACLNRRGEQAFEIEEMGIRLYNVNPNPNKFSKYFTWFSLLKIIRKESIDIVHSHNTGPFLDARLALLFQKKKILFFHTDHARAFPDQFRYMFAEFISSFRANKIVAVSYELKKQLIKHEKISPRKIEVILNGVAQPDKPSIEYLEHLKKKIFPRSFEFVIGLGVVLSDQKGIIHLIHAATKILQVYPDTGFLIAGDGPSRKYLEEKVAHLGLGDNFVFLGFRKDIPILLYLLDVYVFPSEWEGLPLAILEAMAAERCILSTDVGGIPLALTDSSTAVLVPPKRSDLLAKGAICLLANSQLRDKLANRAKQVFHQKFDVNVMVKSYEKLYLKDH